MIITAIKQQLKRPDRYSIFIDGKYEFSLSDAALLESKLITGQTLTPEQVGQYKQISANDKLYNQTLRYVALRPRSKWEIEFYLVRKKVPPPLTENILNKLSNIGLIDDEKFAEAYVNDRRLLRPASRRKLTLELRKKHITDAIIQQAIGNEADDEQAALRAIIERKRRQTKYRDNLKLMQYLSRQGFSYGDIKTALQDNPPD